jgi:hypothetical protein
MDDKTALQMEIDAISQSILEMEHRLNKLTTPLKERRKSLRQELRVIQLQEREVDRRSLQDKGLVPIPGTRCKGYYKQYSWEESARQCWAQAYKDGYCLKHLRNPKYRIVTESHNAA